MTRKWNMRQLISAALFVGLIVTAVPGIASGRHDDKMDQGKKGEKREKRDKHDKGDKGDRHDNRREGRGEDRRDDRRDDRRENADDNRGQNRLRWQQYNQYDYNRPDPRYQGYEADRYYRDGRYYQPRRLSNDDRIYRGSNGRYYCRRNDGTTGLIIGAIGGGVLGRAIAPRGSNTLGAILGGSLGAVIGQSIGRGGVRCR